MKFLVFNWQDITNPLGGGAEVHLHNIFSRVARLGHEVTLVCSSYAGAPAQETIDGIKIIRTGSRAFFNYYVPVAYRRLLRSGGFDVVVDDLNKIPFFTPLFVREPLVGIAHHLFRGNIFRELNPIAAMYVYLMEWAALRIYRHYRIPFFVVSPSSKLEFIAHGFAEKDLPLLFNCVDHTQYRLTGVPKFQAPVVGYFGRLKRYKCVDHFLHALPAIRRQVPTVHALIVGEGDDRRRLERLAVQLGVADITEFTGYVSEERKVVLLQKMWVAVTTSSKEGWGLNVVEANACGTPVVASNVPGLRDAVRDGETGLLFPHGDVGQLASHVIHVLLNEADRNRLREAALRWAQSFNWNASAESFLKEIERRFPPSRA